MLHSHGEEIVTIARASWDGDRLVIVEAVTYPDGRKRNTKTVWWLDSEGQLITEFTEQFEGKPATTIKAIAKKKA